MDLEHIGGNNICGEKEQGRPIVLSIATIVDLSLVSFLETFFMEKVEFGIIT